MDTTDSEASLGVLHQRLNAHFDRLRSQRNHDVGPSFPVFALEHGLSDLDLGLLNTAVRVSVDRGSLPMAESLPFIVYAAEVGYDYSGDEYWQTFAKVTPGWSSIEDRGFVRQAFQDFARRFGGAIPAGPWAKNFSIISWPITHAVLPTDLQQQLVRLIFEYRTGLAVDLLSNPHSLGRKLATRAINYSSRFRYFAQNTELLGQVAAALLSPENEQSPYLLDSTLRRLIESLAAHHQARQWLMDAKTAAHRVRTSGFRRSPTIDGSSGRRHRLDHAPLTTHPVIFLQRSEQGWVTHLQLPDLSLLAEQLPDLHGKLRDTRTRLAGHSSPLARGRLLAGEQRVRLDEWPASQTPLLQLEDSSMVEANRLLADQCVMNPGPAWLFRVREPGLATEVRGKVVRPGHDYVLLVRTDLPTDGRPPWVLPTPCSTTGVKAFCVKTPTVPDERERRALASMGIGMLADVTVRPVGVIPGHWDGQGSLVSVAGDDIIVAIESGKAMTRCIVRIDGKTHVLNLPPPNTEFFVELSELDVGPHSIDFELMSHNLAVPFAEGSLTIEVRAAPVRYSGGSIREGLMLLADPPAPVMEDVWEGRSSLELLGPIGAEVTVTASLERIRGEVLAKEHVKLHTPVDAAKWLKSALRPLQASKVLRDHYDEADVLALTASNPDLGAVYLRCEREFSPLRWVLGRDRHGPYARLVDNTDRSAATVTGYSFRSPDTPEQLSPSSSDMLRWPTGGLLSASSNNLQALVIVPPDVHGDLSDLREALPEPELHSRLRTSDEVLALMDLCDQWASASYFGDPFAALERQKVLRILTAGVVSIAARSPWWSRLERRGGRTDSYVFQELREGVGAEEYQLAIADEISRRLGAWHALDPGKRAHEFGSILATSSYRNHVGEKADRVAEFLLRASSEPSTLKSWPAEEKVVHVERTLKFPFLIRVARFVVLGIHLDSDDDNSDSTYRGWSWT